MVLEIEIDPLYLQDSNEYAGKFKLRSHQSELRNSNDPAILLEAPTSSGKTLAFLLRSLEHFDNTIVLYPTNALMWDQARSIATLIGLLGYRCSIAVEEREGTITWQGENVGSSDVGLYVISADTLSALIEKTHSSEGQVLLHELRRGPTKRILLTNPEILYLLFTYRFTQASKLLDEVFSRTNIGSLLVVDEFHLYYGYSLAIISYLLYMLRNVFTQKIFTSATPSHLQQILLEPTKLIKAEIGNDTLVRYKTLLTIEEYARQGVLGRDSINHLLKEVEKMYDSHQLSYQGIKVVIILNSVLTADMLSSSLEDLFPNEVVSIHGLVPRTARSSLAPIVVGTSAIEVGIDFDTPSLIFEAYDSTAFIQRFGRGGRHHKCDILCFIPSKEIPFLERQLPDHPLGYNDLVTTIINTMPTPNKYYEFVWSIQGAQIFYALLLSMNQYLVQRDIKFGYHSQGRFIKLLKQQILDSKVSSPEPIQNYLKEVVSNGKNLPSINALSKNMSVRSSLDSIPAYFSKYSSFDTVSLQEIARLDFETFKLKDIELRISRIPYKMKRHERILWINSIREKPVSFRISFDRVYFNSLRRLVHEDKGNNNNFDIYFLDPESDSTLESMRKHVIELINYQPACALSWREDWRMTGLYGPNSSFLAIGGDAFLADYLKNARWT
jgi:hypothetical protein